MEKGCKGNARDESWKSFRLTIGPGCSILDRPRFLQNDHGFWREPWCTVILHILCQAAMQSLGYESKNDTLHRHNLAWKWFEACQMIRATSWLSSER